MAVNKPNQTKLVAGFVVALVLLLGLFITTRSSNPSDELATSTGPAADLSDIGATTLPRLDSVPNQNQTTSSETTSSPDTVGTETNTENSETTNSDNSFSVANSPTESRMFTKAPSNGWQTFNQFGLGSFTNTNVNIDPDGGQDGSVRVVCHASHFNYDDPIVFPGESGAAHFHMFFGNTAADAYSTTESLRDTGDGTCQGGPLNRSAYWIPALFDQNDNVRVPQYSLIYYKSGPLHGQNIQEFPEGLKMIAGNARAGNASENGAQYNWYCGWPQTGKSQVGKTIPNCSSGSFLSLALAFPNCWDGKNLDSANHQNHMSYSNGNSCPATHPVPVPQVTYNIHWNNNDTSTNGWYLSSDKHSGLNVPGGTTTHGDWFGAWHPDALSTFVNNCNNANHDCKGGTISTSLRLSDTSSPWSIGIYNSGSSPLVFSKDELLSR